MKLAYLLGLPYCCKQFYYAWENRSRLSKASLLKPLPEVVLTILNWMLSQLALKILAGHNVPPHPSRSLSVEATLVDGAISRSIVLWLMIFSLWCVVRPRSRCYSVDFSQSWIGEKSAFSTNAQSRFASAVFWRCLGTSTLNAAHLTVSLFLCSSGSNAQVKGP